MHLFLQALQNHVSDISAVLYATVVSSCNLYVYCHFGEFTSSCFEKYPKYLFEMHWYRLPNKFQKYFILMIGNSQRPLKYDSYRLAILNREIFLKVITKYDINSLLSHIIIDLFSRSFVRLDRIF